MTPRRCQKFKAATGTKVAWKNVSAADGKEVQSGEAVSEEPGRVTIPNVTVTKGGNRVTLQVLK